MGCLKSIINKIIFVIAVVAFFFFGGCNFVADKYNEFSNPPREELIKESRDFGNFSNISSDYRLTRSLNLAGYRKFNAQYLPSGQKITILDLNDNNIIAPKDFYSKVIDEKIEELLSKFKDSFITLENLQITGRGTIVAKGRIIPYVNFKADVKNIPFKSVEGMIGAYSSPNITKAKKGKTPEETVKIIVSVRNTNKYNQQISTNFIKDIRF